MIDSFILTSAVTALTFAIVYYHAKKFTFWSSRGVKGPLPVPLFGNNISYMLNNKIDVEREWAQKYGRVYGIYQGYKPILIMLDNELIKQVHIKRFALFTDRDAKSIYGDQIKRWLFWSRGDHWTNQRALITPLFSSSKMRVIFEKMTSSVDRFLQELNTRIVGQGKVLSGSQVLISRDELMASTMDALAYSFFSLKIDTYKDKTSEFFKRAFAFATFDFGWSIFWLAIPRAICTLLKLDLTPYSKYEYFDKLSQKTIDERRKAMASNSPGKKSEQKAVADVIQSLLDAKIPEQYEQIYTNEDDADAHYNDNQDHNELERINQQQSERVKFRKFEDIEIRAQMTFFFLAGFETTSSALTFCFYELGHQQAAQQDVYLELLEHTKQLGRQVSDYSDLMNLKKLDAFISESLRLYNPVTNNQRVVTAKEGVVLETDNIRPINLPYGTVTQVNGFLVQRDAEYWNEPLKFDMSRFYQENKDKIKSCTYMPFGVGPRNCVGMRFALLEMKLLLAKTLLKYRVYPGAKSDSYPPKFKRHFFFTQLVNTDVKLVPRGPHDLAA